MVAGRAASAHASGVRPQPASRRLAWQWMAAHAVMTFTLLLPAIWNGFPFVFADTGGYFIRPFEGFLELGRSALYGAFLAAAIPLDFWPNVVVQALACAWIVVLVLRVHGLDRPAVAVALVAALCLATSLPWYAGQLMPDVFVPLSVLGFYLIAFAAQKLRGAEVAALIAVIAFAIAAHMSIYGVLLFLFACFLGVRVAAPNSTVRPRLGLPAAALAAGTVLAIGSNWIIAGTAAFTPGGPTFLFARLLQDGFVKAYLDRHCPRPDLSLCPYRDKLPATADDWLWSGNSPLARLGEWQGFSAQATRIIMAILHEQPGANVRAVVADTAVQLVAVATGDGFDGRTDWYTQWKLHDYAPKALPAFNASAQQRNAIDFELMNFVQEPLALAATFALPFLIVLCWRRRALATPLVLTVCLGLYANALVCAAFSGTNDRYQSRIVSIGVLAAALAGWELSGLRRRNRPARAVADAALRGS